MCADDPFRGLFSFLIGIARDHLHCCMAVLTPEVLIDGQAIRRPTHSEAIRCIFPVEQQRD